MKRVTQSLAFLLCLCLAACATNSSRTPVDLVLTNGKVITVDPDFSIRDTVVVNDGRIVATGDSTLARKYRARKVVDLHGKTLMPGFNDSHVHINGNPKRHIELGKVRSIAEMQDLIRAKAKEMGPGEWITGYGWSEDQLAELRKPLRGDLDLAAPRNPVTLTRAGAHSAVVNSLALELAGITDATPDPEGGVIERDESGHANGVIRERQNIVGRLVPGSTPGELMDSLEKNLRDLFALGITSITDASKSPAAYRMWEQLYDRPGIRLPRATLQILWQNPPEIAALYQRVGRGDDRLKPGAIKVFADGGFTGPAAFTKEPYLHQGDYRGYLNMPEEELRKTLNDVHDAGYQVGVHAIGDAAIERVVDILADALDRKPHPDQRNYLNHFSMRPSDATMDKMAAHGIEIDQQPNFTYTLEGRYVANLDGWRLEHNNPIRSPMDHGITVGLSSDILPIGPFIGLYAAVTRKGMSGRVFGADEAITIEEAIRGYTLTGAWLNFDEDVKGSLEPGKYADMIVLSDDILTIDPERILQLEVEQTWLGGELVYQRAAGAQRTAGAQRAGDARR